MLAVLLGLLAAALIAHGTLGGWYYDKAKKLTYYVVGALVLPTYFVLLNHYPWLANV